MNILCVCAAGLNRSSRLAFELRQKGYVSIAVGLHSSRTIRSLEDWADRVITVESGYKGQLPIDLQKITEEWTEIGPDRYSSPHDPKLGEICLKLIERHGL